MIDGKPTVNLYLTTGSDTTVLLTVTKDALQSGFKIKAENQRNGTFQISIRYKSIKRGFGSPDYIEFEVKERNDEKKYMDIRLSGYINQIDRDANLDLEIKPTTIRISGSQFIETVRSHTKKELSYYVQ